MVSIASSSSRWAFMSAPFDRVPAANRAALGPGCDQPPSFLGECLPASSQPAHSRAAGAGGRLLAMTRTRRQLIREATGLGVGAAAVGLFGCEEENEVADAASPSCTLTPEVTEGPYYLDLDKVRRNVTEGKHGL